MAVHELWQTEKAGKYRDGIFELIPLRVKYMVV
jgi:hypothetical protein